MYAGLDVACIQNAAIGRETHIPHKIPKAAHRRRIVIVGGGPGGMEAARVSGERGHEVILLERDDALGGQVNLATRAPARDQMAQMTSWLSMELKRLGVDTRFNTDANAELVRGLEPDVVILATGGKPNLDGFASWRDEPGMQVVSTHEIFQGRAMPGKNVIIYDVMGTYAGATCADYLVSRGSLVEIVSPDMSIGEDLGGTVRPVYNRRLLEKEVIFTPNFGLRHIYHEDDKVVAVLRNEYTNQEEERVVDQVILENGVIPDEALYYELKPSSRNHGQIDLEALFASRPQPEPPFNGDYLLYRVGDCVSARDVHAAIYDSLRLCKDF